MPTMGDIDAAFKAAAPDFEYDGTRAVRIDGGVFNLEQFKACCTRRTITFIRAAQGLAAFRAQYDTPLTKQRVMRRCVRQRSDD